MPEGLRIRLSSHPTSILDSSAIEFCCVGVSTTARLLSICELPLLATALAAFIAQVMCVSANQTQSP